MAERGMDRLRSLLFGAERRLVNIKFFPGSDRGLTSDKLAGAAADAISAALKKGDNGDNPPFSGLKKASFR